MKQTSTVEKITPSVAAQWLSDGHNIRVLKQHWVKVLQAAIERDAFTLTNDAIAFDEKGVLINGQHRLAACVAAKKPITCAVVRGVTNDLHIDLGMGRAANQILQRNNVRNASHVGTAARLVWLFIEGRMGAFWSSQKDKVVILEGVLDVVDKHPGLEASVAAVNVVGRMRISVGVMGAIHYLGGTMQPENMAAFTSGIISGSNLSPGDPALALRNCMSASTYAAQRGRIHTADQLFYVSTAWQAYAQGRKLTRLVRRYSDSFPVFDPAIWPLQWVKPKPKSEDF